MRSSRCRGVCICALEALESPGPPAHYLLFYLPKITCPFRYTPICLDKTKHHRSSLPRSDNPTLLYAVVTLETTPPTGCPFVQLVKSRLFTKSRIHFAKYTFCQVQRWQTPNSQRRNSGHWLLSFSPYRTKYMPSDTAHDVRSTLDIP